MQRAERSSEVRMAEQDEAERVLKLHRIGEGLAVPDWVHFIGGTMSGRSRLRGFLVLCYFCLPFFFFIQSGGFTGILLGLGLGALCVAAYIHLGRSHFPAALLPLAILLLLYLRWSQDELGGGGLMVLELGLGFPMVLALFNELVEIAQSWGNPWLVLDRSGAFAICYRARRSKTVLWSAPWAEVQLGVEAHSGYSGKSGPVETQYFLVAAPATEKKVRIHLFAKDLGKPQSGRKRDFREQLPALHAAVARWLAGEETGDLVKIAD